MRLAKQLVILLTFLSLLLTTMFTWAKHDGPLLVLDMKNVAEYPRNFRSTLDLKANSEVNLTGLAELNMAGGGQFSVAALKKVMEYLHGRNITIIDLRQESHGFLDNNAVSWYGPHDAANAKKTPAQIEDDQSDRLDALEASEVANVFMIVKKNPAEIIELVLPIKIPIHLVFSEEELALSQKLNYERFYVQDFHAPQENEVDRFVKMVKEIPKDEWLYFHCRAGVGRTTTFMAMYDMLRNAKHVSFQDILERQTTIGGKDMNDMPERGKWKYQFAVERLHFLKKFYQYAHTNTDNFATSWSAWSANHHKK